jgi:hypothetical protein
MNSPLTAPQTGDFDIRKLSFMVKNMEGVRGYLSAASIRSAKKNESTNYFVLN